MTEENSVSPQFRLRSHCVLGVRSSPARAREIRPHRNADRLWRRHSDGSKPLAAMRGWTTTKRSCGAVRISSSRRSSSPLGTSGSTRRRTIRRGVTTRSRVDSRSGPRLHQPSFGSLPGPGPAGVTAKFAAWLNSGPAVHPRRSCGIGGLHSLGTSFQNHHIWRFAWRPKPPYCAMQYVFVAMR
jgi:hypothetical protein